MTKTEKTTTIDATNRRIGRLASEIATLLNGKDRKEYAPNKVPDITVNVTNAAKMDVTDKKKKEKIYERYTGYFGGRKELTLSQVVEKKGYGEVVRRAVYGMLPENRLRKEKMRKLHVNE